MTTCPNGVNHFLHNTGEMVMLQPTQQITGDSFEATLCVVTKPLRCLGAVRYSPEKYTILFIEIDFFMGGQLITKHCGVCKPGIYARLPLVEHTRHYRVDIKADAYDVKTTLTELPPGLDAILTPGTCLYNRLNNITGPPKAGPLLIYPLVSTIPIRPLNLIRATDGFHCVTCGETSLDHTTAEKCLTLLDHINPTY